MQLSAPEITKLCKGFAEFCKELQVDKLVKSEIDGKKAKVGTFLASLGTELSLGDLENNGRLQPSDEFIRIVQWMQMYQ